MLKAVAEEAIRTLVRTFEHSRIYALRSSAADVLLQILNHSVCQIYLLFYNTISSKILESNITPPRLQNALYVLLRFFFASSKFTASTRSC